MRVQTPEKPGRIASLDQFRGYAIFGMLWVNYLGAFKCMPELFKHHDEYITYADTIAPVFMFVVGIGFRLSLIRRIAQDGAYRAYRDAVRRYLVLIGVGVVLYGPLPENWRYWWDALVDIGFGALLALPFLMSSVRVRMLVSFACWGLYQLLYLTTGYGAWTMAHSIDGGPLGPLSWAPILLFGTIAYDLIAARDNKNLVTACLAWGLGLSATGFLLYLPWGDLKAQWLFSQRSMEIPYPILATGLCFLTYLPFHYLNDVRKFNIPTLTLIGMNPLILYILQNALCDLYGPLVVPEDSGILLALVGFVFLYGCCYAVAWKFKKDNVIIKL